MGAPASLPPPKWPDFGSLGKGGGGGGGGGGAGKDTETQFQNLMMTMEKEVAAASKNSYDVVSALYDDLIAKVQKYASSAEESEEGIAEANKVKSAKMKLVEEQFQQWQLKSTGGAYQKIDEEQQADHAKWGSQHGGEITGIFDTQRSAEDLKVQETPTDHPEERRGRAQPHPELRRPGQDHHRINATQKDIRHNRAAYVKSSPGNTTTPRARSTRSWWTSKRP